MPTLPRHKLRTLSGVLAAGLIALVASPVSGFAQESALRAIVSVVPLRTIVERVGGDRVQVESLVVEGASPATYEPTPRQMTRVSEAHVLFRVGVPFEGIWVPRLRGVNSDMRVVDLRQGIDLRKLEVHDHPDEGHDDSHDHESGDPAHSDSSARDEHEGESGDGNELDPHVWTSPRNMMRMAGHVRDTLIDLDPAGADAYRRNHLALIADLEALDAEIRSILADVKRRRFLVFHPAWGYFAEAYGLEQIAIETRGKSPGAGALTRVIEQARAEDIHVVFVQQEYSRADAATVARALDGEVVVVDPLAPDYFSSLRRAAQAFGDVLR